jgi:hypothetical protein
MKIIAILILFSQLILTSISYSQWIIPKAGNYEIKITQNSPAAETTFADYSNKELKDFPVEILRFKNLTELDLSGNELTTLPKSIKKLSRLKILRINGNKIYSLPDELHRLKFLKEIYLDREIWQYRLEEIKKLTSAKIFLVG